MRLSTTVFSIFSLAVAASNKVVGTIELETESSNPKYDGKGIYELNQIKGALYLVLSDAFYTDFLHEDGIVCKIPGSYCWGLTGSMVTENLMGPGIPPVVFNGEYLTINGSDSVFYACNNDPVLDPEGSFHVDIHAYNADETVPGNCESIKIKLHDPVTPVLSTSVPGAPSTEPTSVSVWATSASAVAEATTSGVSSSQGVPQSSAETEQPTETTQAAAATPSSPAGQSTAPTAITTSSGLYNVTVTAETTKFTTITCLSPTAFAYGDHTYTVSSATTLTVKDCGCTAYPVAPTIAASQRTSAPPILNGASNSKAGLGALSFLVFAAVL